MGWVNVFDNEDVTVNVGDDAGEAGGPIVVEAGASGDFTIYELSTEGGPVDLYRYELLDGIRGIRRYDQGGFGDNDVRRALMVPSDGLVGRLFRVRIHEGFLVTDGTGFITAGPMFIDINDFLAFDDPPNKAAFEFEGSGDPAPTTDWAELPAIPAHPGVEPDADWGWLGTGAGEPVHGGFYEWQVWVDEAPTCNEIGRVSKANVSAFDRTRIHSVRLNPTERRCLVANFHGAIAASRTIVSATWQAEANASVALSGGAISADGRETNVMITAYRGPGAVTIQCTATLDNGEIYNQLFVAEIGWTPFQMNNPAPSGQQTIVVNA